MSTTDMKLLLDPIWAWPWVVLAAAATLATVITTYRRRIAHLPTAQRRTLLGLRLAAWALLIFSFLRPSFEYTHLDPHASVFMVLLDASRSMGVKDGTAGMSRREVLLKTLADAKTDLETLGKKIEIKTFDFDRELVPVEAPGPATNGEMTAHGPVLDAIPNTADRKRVAAVLLIGDGANRALPPYDTDPRAAAIRLADQQIPIYAVGIGGSGLSDSSLDLAAEDFEVSPTVFVKNNVVVGAKVRALGAAGRDVVVHLKLEDPASALPGQPAPMRLVSKPITLKPKGNQELIPIEGLSFIATDPGEFKLTLEVVQLEGEPIVTNNSLTTYITVLKGGINVAYFDREHRFEMKYIRRIDESPDIQLDLKPIRSGPLGARPPIEEEWFEPGRYDVYIIGSVKATTFGPKILEKLARAVDQGAGLMMTGGTYSFGPGGYADSPLADVLPVVMRRTELQNGEKVDLSLHHPPPVQMLPTAAGLQHFIMRIDTPERNLARWKALPPLDGANKFTSLKPLAQTLAESPEGYPLLVALPYGRGRTIAFAGDSTYHWYMHRPNHEEHQRFWQQLMLWLAHKDQQGDESVWVKLEGRRFRAGQPVGFTFGARDADKRPIDDAEFRIEVRGPGERKQSVMPTRSGTDHSGRFLDTRQAGEYHVHVEASKGGNSIGLPAEARFVVYEQDLELHNPAADIPFLEELTRITGGAMIPPEELGAHLRRLGQQGLNLEITEVAHVSLWDHWWLLIAFAGVMSLEWYLRKKRGLV